MPTDADGFEDLSGPANLRAALNVWPADKPLSTPDDVARAAFAITLGDVLAGEGAAINLLRFAEDGGSVWLLDALEGVSIEDFVRAVAGVFEPAAYAIAVIQPMYAPGDPALRGVTCRAALGDDVIELTGEVAPVPGQPDARHVPQWNVRRGRTHTDAARWIGVPPTVEVRLPMFGVGEA